MVAHKVHAAAGAALSPLVTPEEMDAIFMLCLGDNWAEVLQRVTEKPYLAVHTHQQEGSGKVPTTIIHLAISGNIRESIVGLRAEVIRTILKQTPEAARMKNDNDYLPLHVICQRTKKDLIFELVDAHKDALLEQGGRSNRTPLHLILAGKHSETNTAKELLFFAYLRRYDSPLAFSFGNSQLPCPVGADDDREWPIRLQIEGQ